MNKPNPDKQDPNEDREVKRTTEARQGEVGKGGPMRWVLFVSLALVIVAFVIIYLAFLL